MKSENWLGLARQLIRCSSELDSSLSTASLYCLDIDSMFGNAYCAAHSNAHRPSMILAAHVCLLQGLPAASALGCTQQRDAPVVTVARPCLLQQGLKPRRLMLCLL